MSVTVKRVGYRLAYRLLQLFWLIAHPSQTGVKCLLSHGGRILLVRHTYGPRSWDLPGGMVKRGEDPAVTARREMHEELGVVPPQWTDLGSVHASLENRHDTIHVFGAELTSPSLTVDPAELDVAEWFAPGELPPMRPLGAQILRHALPLVVPRAA
ncbi:MAG TPA: NUDIX domain-containing protein [Solirubrobacteraceae bacterium]|jgi:8-oxo-dGTP pyrophosphatase MutT (NUDIX family)|nr:NUDIX domain-containing protein [Solirubrobacteraceae bacterium]